MNWIHCTNLSTLLISFYRFSSNAVKWKSRTIFHHANVTRKTAIDRYQYIYWLLSFTAIGVSNPCMFHAKKNVVNGNTSTALLLVNHRSMTFSRILVCSHFIAIFIYNMKKSSTWFKPKHCRNRFYFDEVVRWVIWIDFTQARKEEKVKKWL